MLSLLALFQNLFSTIIQKQHSNYSTKLCKKHFWHWVFKSQTPFVLETSILLPHSGVFQSLPIPENSIKTSLFILCPMAPQKSEIKQLVTSTESKVHSLKAAIFHTMAYKMSLEINKGNINLPTRHPFLKVLHNVCQIKKKQITFDQYYRVHVNGPKIAICEISFDTVFDLNSAFTTNDNYFQVQLDDAIDAFNAVLLDFGYTQQLQRYNPEIHQVHPPSKHPFWPKNYT